MGVRARRDGSASVVWFAGLGYGAQALRPLFAKPAAWRGFEMAVAAIMFSVATGLLLGLRPAGP